VPAGGGLDIRHSLRAHPPMSPWPVAMDLKPKRKDQCCRLFYNQIRPNANFLTVTLQVLYNEINHL